MSARIPAPVWVGTVALSALKQEGTVHILAICWEYCYFFRTLIGETVLSSSGVSGTVRRPILALSHRTLWLYRQDAEQRGSGLALWSLDILFFFPFTYCSQLWYYSAILLCQRRLIQVKYFKMYIFWWTILGFFWTTDKCLTSCDNPEGLSYKNK